MLKTNALYLRQNMGEVIKNLLTTGEPILLEKGKVPVGVIISLDDYKKRFVDYEAHEKRKSIISAIKNAKIDLPTGVSSIDIIHDLRNGAFEN